MDTTEPLERTLGAAVLVEGFPAQAAGTNCWVVAPGRGEQCLIVDPGVGVGPQLDDVLSTHHLHPVAVLLTHGHLDHTFSVVPVCQARGVPAYLHPADRDQLADPYPYLPDTAISAVFTQAGLTFAEPDDLRELSADTVLELAGLRLRVQHAPGHSAGSVVFGYGDPAGVERPGVFTGDVLFAGSVGRTDLLGGSAAQMTTSLREVVLPLADETVVHPGHGPATTIGRERRTNPFLTGLAR